MLQGLQLPQPGGTAAAPQAHRRRGETGALGVVEIQAPGPALEPDELSPFRLAVLFEPVGEDQARGVVLRVVLGGVQEGTSLARRGVFGHRKLNRA